MPSETLFAFQTAFLQQIEIKNVHARHSRESGNPNTSLRKSALRHSHESGNLERQISRNRFIR
ncbi:TPA: hypothetical protein ACFRG8_000387 [Neisseria lactamica]